MRSPTGLLSADFRKYVLSFKTPMGTSRGWLSERIVYLLSLRSEEGATGIGECAPVPGLSPDAGAQFEEKLAAVCREVNAGGGPELNAWPAIRFGLETARRDLQNRGCGILFESDFTRGRTPIPINGLIHMGDVPDMRAQLRHKVEAGFRCIKIKIGALDFQTEQRFLREVRSLCPPGKFELRLDANGAFIADMALHKIEQLAQFDVHSIEQPIKPGQWKALGEICRRSPIPVALDEELIRAAAGAERMLDIVQPAFLVLKPTLLGGFAAGERWLRLARSRGIGCWVSSILESNIGLSAIAQWTATLGLPEVQGLGTGRLFSANFDAPVALESGTLVFKPGVPGAAGRALSELEPI